MRSYLLTPFNLLNNILDEDFGLLPARDFAYPAINMYEEDGNLVIETELAGFSPDDVQVSFDQGNLIIRGSKRQERKEGGKKRRYFVKEIVDRSFERVIPLPDQIDIKKADAQFKNGVLKVAIPLLKERKSQNIIPIKIAK